MAGRKQFVLWILAAILAMGGLLMIVAREQRVPARKHAAYVVGIPERGAQLFFGEKGCATCHAVNGTGGREGPDLGSIHPVKPAMGWLTAVLWNHAPAMWGRMGVRQPSIDQEEMAHLLAFLYNAGTGDRPGDAEAGHRVFDEKGCSRCHRQAPGVTDATAWARAMWNHAHTMSDAIRAGSGEWPEFFGDEMNDLMAFAGAGRAPDPAGGNEKMLRGSADRGWTVFQNKCMRCHSVGGSGGRIGPELGPDYDLPHSSAQFATVLWNHAPAMLKHAREAALTMPNLQGDEIRDVQTFLISLQYFEPHGSRFVGRRLFAERGCARCHGAAAEGTAEGPRLRAGADAFTTISLATALWTHGPEMRSRAARLGIAWPALKSTDIGDLITFLNDPADPRP